MTEDHRRRLHDISVKLINERVSLSRCGDDRVVISTVVAHLRDTAAELMALIGDMQTDLDKRR